MTQKSIPQLQTHDYRSKDQGGMSIHTPKNFRFQRAFWATLRILISIGSFHLLAKLFSSEWKQQRISEKYQQNARKLKKSILSLKGIFIKVGQLISILSNFLPEDFRKELEELQDRIPQRPIKEITGRIQKEFGKTPDLLFSEFDKTAIASASLAQVHLARLHDGRQVAVKVQYLDIEATAKKDLKTIKRLLSFVGIFVHIKGLSKIHPEISEMIKEELDFRIEAKNIETISSNFIGVSGVYFPKVIPELSSERVLTAEFIDGFNISDLDKIAAYKLDRLELAERILTTYCKMIFSDGIYHADPHPGNILVKPDGSIVFLDFGAVSKLSDGMKAGIPRFIEGVLKRDNSQISSALKQMGFVGQQVDYQQIDEIIEYFYRRFLEGIPFDSWNLADIQVDIQMKMEVMADFRKMNISMGELFSLFHIPKDWILLERTILLLMGLCTHLCPEMNPIKTIRPYLEEFVLGKDKNWAKFIQSAVKDITFSAISLPSNIQNILTRANQGELEIKLKGQSENVKLMYILGHQLLFGMFVMFFSGAGYLALKQGDVFLSKGFFSLSVFFLFSLGISFWRARKWLKKIK